MVIAIIARIPNFTNINKSENKKLIKAMIKNNDISVTAAPVFSIFAFKS